jgi:hypothetical protein
MHSLGIKKLRFTWAVVNSKTGRVLVSGLASRLHAQYAAARINGQVKDSFIFGQL